LASEALNIYRSCTSLLEGKNYIDSMQGWAAEFNSLHGLQPLNTAMSLKKIVLHHP